MITERNLFLPVTIALGVHLLAFITIRGSKAAERPVDVAGAHTPPVIRIVMPNDEPEPLILAGETAASSAPVASPPEIDDRPEPPQADRFSMDAQPPRPVTDIESLVPNVSLPGVGGNGINTGPVISSALLDNEPHARFQRPPQFPFEARRQGKTGHVLVEFTVDENGRVLNPHVLSSNDSQFDATTLAAVGAWRFEPGRRDGKIVRFRMQLPVDFTLQGD